MPLDHTRPNGGTIGIRILRAPASDPGQRIGALVLNRGGPGLSLVEQMPTSYASFKLFTPELARRFDFIGFDWRGVGQSSPVDCISDAELDEARGRSAITPFLGAHRPARAHPGRAPRPRDALHGRPAPHRRARTS